MRRSRVARKRKACASRKAMVKEEQASKTKRKNGMGVHDVQVVIVAQVKLETTASSWRKRKARSNPEARKTSQTSGAAGMIGIQNQNGKATGTMRMNQSGTTTTLMATMIRLENGDTQKI